MTARPSLDALVTTRESLHRAAEHLLAATRKRATGQITLLPGDRGVRTPALPDGRTLAIEGAELVVRDPQGERRARLTTLAQAAREVGIEPGFPWTKHPPGTEFDPDAPLVVDEAAALALADWFRLGEAALMALAVEIGDEQPTEPQLFPEHFDLAITAGRVNYGFSPGDDLVHEPYAYVGPHGLVSGDPFWNAPFGAYRTWQEIGHPADALAFFHQGRSVLGL